MVQTRAHRPVLTRLNRQPRVLPVQLVQERWVRLVLRAHRLVSIKLSRQPRVLPVRRVQERWVLPAQRARGPWVRLVPLAQREQERLAPTRRVRVQCPVVLQLQLAHRIQ